MAVDAIKKVTETEEKSKNLLDMAAAEGKALVAGAQKQGAALVEQSRAEAEAQVRQLMTEAEEKAAKNAEGILAQAGEACRELEASARTRMERAAARIVERVVNS